MNSRTLNGLPSGRSSRTSRVAFPRDDDRRVLNGIFWSCAQVLPRKRAKSGISTLG
jgi:hypothetical protein